MAASIPFLSRDSSPSAGLSRPMMVVIDVDNCLSDRVTQPKPQPHSQPQPQSLPSPIEAASLPSPPLLTASMSYQHDQDILAPIATAVVPANTPQPTERDPLSSDRKNMNHLCDHRARRTYHPSGPRGRVSGSSSTYLEHRPSGALEILTQQRRSSTHHEWAWRSYFLLPMSVLVPIMITVVIFAALPLRSPDTDVDDRFVFIFITNPLIYGAYAGLMSIFFYAVLDETRPWRRPSFYLPPIFATMAVEIVVMLLIYPFTGTFAAMGLIPLLVAHVTVYLTLKRMERVVWHCQCSHYRMRLKEFRKIVVGAFVFILMLSVWVVSFRYGDDAYRAASTVILLFVVFFFKKYILAVTTSYPIEIAMILSGLWLESLDDVFQSVVFPSVPRSTVFIYGILFGRKFLENLAYLFFLTKRWFLFRVWIKDFLKRSFTCRLQDEPAHPEWHDRNLDDRGHSNEQPGYLRRQTQFFFYKILSQMHSHLNYLAVAPAVRFSYNGRYFPLSESGSGGCLTPKHFRISMIFASMSFVATAITGYLGYWIVQRYQRRTFLELHAMYGSIISSPIYVGFVGAILTTSSLLAFSVTAFHNRIWYFEGNFDPVTECTTDGV
eukprot:m.85678 g.85678  ORF g.85678 m.85678 type:complete len:607 (+) comp14730_c0_seq1:166-1986(+)